MGGGEDAGVVGSAGGGGPGEERLRGDIPITVVLPVRDGEPTLGAALESLRAQTFAHFEVVVVDDHSRDGTAAIAREWERRDGRFRVVRMGAGGVRGVVGSQGGSGAASGAEADTGGGPAALAGSGTAEHFGTHRDRVTASGAAPSGIVAALQRGLAEARGRYIARMDADDRCHPERLAVQYDLLERTPGLAGCGTGVRLVPESAVTPRGAEYAAWVNSMTDWDTVVANIFVECPLAHPTFMFRARVLAEAGGYRDRAWPEDYDLLLRLWRRGHRFVCVPRVLLDWRDEPGRLSRNHPAYSLAAFRACRVHHLRRSLLRGRSGVVVWGAGPTGKSLAREFARQGVSVLAFVEVDPRKIGQQIHGAPVYGVEAVRGVWGWGGGVGALHVGAVARSAGRAGVRGAVGGRGWGRGWTSWRWREVVGRS